MTNFVTLMDGIASDKGILSKRFEDLLRLIRLVVNDDLDGTEDSLVGSWVDQDDTCVDFYIALRPAWLVGAPDNRQVKTCVTVDTESRSWSVRMVVDCEDGEIESWGEVNFGRDEVKEYVTPIQEMLDTIRGQYDRKLWEENSKAGKTLVSGAVEVSGRIAKHAEAIRRICKKSGVRLYVDRSLENGPVVRVVPDGLSVASRRDGGAGIPAASFPRVDLELLFYNSEHDKFGRG